MGLIDKDDERYVLADDKDEKKHVYQDPL